MNMRLFLLLLMLSAFLLAAALPNDPLCYVADSAELRTRDGAAWGVTLFCHGQGIVPMLVSHDFYSYVQQERSAGYDVVVLRSKVR